MYSGHCSGLGWMGQLKEIEDQHTRGHGFATCGTSFASGLRMPHQSDIGPGRAHRVYGAILDSRRHTSILVRRDAGLAGLENILPTLLDACREFAFSVCVRMARGWHGLGRSEHIFADYFGLRLLDAYPSAQLAEACRCYERGFKEAWGGDPHPGYDNSHCDGYVSSFADHTFASGHAALISAFFKAIHAYLLSPANRPATLLAQIRQNTQWNGKLDAWLLSALKIPGESA